MRYFLIISAVLLAACLAASSPVERERRLVDTPSVQDLFTRIRRSEQYTKGRGSGTTQKKHPLEASLRKGEYLCGEKICKLKPGEKPPCPVCQYPL